MCTFRTVFAVPFTITICLAVFAAGLLKAEDENNVSDGWLNTPNRFSGCDSERIAKAIAASQKCGGIVRIPPRSPDAESDRTFWLLDEAILIPGNTTLYLDNAVLKLSDRCRDNFIRSANAGLGIEKPEPLENIHLIGLGRAELIGADHPRATGDGAKELGVRSFGTDAGRPGESQKGDWRNIGVLLVNVNRFSIRGLTIREPHCWSMSLEKCSFGRVRDLEFYSTENRVIDGQKVKTLNQDGLDLRKGCHDIFIENISGSTGDDLLALTAIRANAAPGGRFESTEAGETDPDANNDIYNITIRNVIGFSNGGHQIVRFLNASGIKIHHVLLDGVFDSSPENITDKVTVKIGDSNPAWGGPTPLGDTYGLHICNIESKSAHAVMIAGSLCDSTIRSVVNYNPDVDGVTFASGRENVRNVQIEEFINAAKKAE